MIDAGTGAGCSAQNTVNCVVVEIVEIMGVAVVVCVLVDDGLDVGSFATEANGE